jgi:anti-sigma regulatory factor (Ser/Thr protein kinase)
MPPLRLEANLPRDSRAPGKGRRMIEGLVGKISHDLVERSKLVVSELLTNALLHAGTAEGARPIRLVVRVEPAALRISVEDDGPGFDPPRPDPRPDAEAGRGLFLVDHLCDRWGIDRDHTTLVWCELGLRGAA